MEDCRQEFRNSPSAGKQTLIINIVLSVLFFFIATLPLLDPEISITITIVFSAAGCIVLGLGFWLKKRLEQDKSPKLIVARHFIHAPTVTKRPVPWENVEKVVFVKQRSRRPGYIAIDVKGDLSQFEPAASTNRWSKVNEVLGGGELIIQTIYFDETHEDILQAIGAANPDTMVEFR